MLFSRFFSNMGSLNTVVRMVLCTSVSYGLAISPSIAEETMSAVSSSADTGCGTANGEMSLSKDAPNTTPDTVAPDYVLQAETSIAPKLFEQKDFSMKTMVQSSIVYYPVAAAQTQTNYERIWYNDGKPVGMERNVILNIPTDKNVQIKIVQSPCSSFDETRAASNIILRLVLDVLKNKDKVQRVSVPSSSYMNMLFELQHRGASVMPPGEQAPKDARVKFDLESESTGMKQAIYFM